MADEHLTDVGAGNVRVATGAFLAIALLMALDLAGDRGEGADVGHLVVEALAMVAAFGGAFVLWQTLRTAAARVASLDVDLAATRAEAARFQAEAADALRGLGEAIDTQFRRWALTPAEREVGLLLLKGLSHREVAELPTTSEQTVRQQALVIYRKAGLRNRAELSAFFLEDLLLPAAER